MAIPLPTLAAKDMWSDLPRYTAINLRANKYISFYPKECYQINPYTKKMLTFTTGKVGEKRPVPCYKEIPGYERIRWFYDKKFTIPICKCNQSLPETEYQRHGWFKRKSSEEDRDERFVYTHRTPEFIKTKILISLYDQAFKGL